ncbi:hypothetical protein [Aeromonas hydrophila]|uniref:hypothetical protein n=1 Tax=Aeromonas hydrophila TaxID=644 RepID=UPI001C5B0981|nr:hypothetical protein [Aeromonas hydrophila]MBW3844996.1 hypothetical protein [Aeromonas hydrophila]
MSQDNQSKIEQIMKEPSPLEATEYEERIRRNLLVFSMAACLSLFLEISPTNKTEIWGIGFENLTVKSFYTVLLLVICYEFIHYLWIIWDKFAFWRVRLTGCKLEVRRGSTATFGSSNSQSDSTGKEVNSNLYVWMIERAPSYHAVMDQIDKKQTELTQMISNVNNEQLGDTVLSQVRDTLVELDKHIITMNEYLNSMRVNESLKRFDNWFDLMIKTQSIRWLMLDVILPTVSGVIAIFMVIKELLDLQQSNPSNLMKLPVCMMWSI